jgi:antitoxin FitA
MKRPAPPPIAANPSRKLPWNQNGFKLVLPAREAAMPVNITLKNIPEPLYQRLKASAEAHRRSINMEAITLLEQAFAPKRVISVKERLERIRQIHETLGPIKTSHDEIDAFKREGRE